MRLWEVWGCCLVEFSRPFIRFLAESSRSLASPDKAFVGVVLAGMDLTCCGVELRTYTGGECVVVVSVPRAFF